jgi:hypothetical protein
MNGIDLTPGVDFEWSKNKVTIFADAIDGRTGEIVVTITSAFAPSWLDLLIPVALLAFLLLLVLVVLLWRKKSKKG